MTAALLFVAAVLGGAIAALSGFGIGSVLTPFLALSVGTKQAVVAVSIPHLVATGIRFWNLRHKVDRHLLVNFGIASAAGGLLGAWLGSRFSSPVLAYILGGPGVCRIHGAHRTLKEDALRQENRLAWRSFIRLAGWTCGKPGRRTLGGHARFQS